MRTTIDITTAAIRPGLADRVQQAARLEPTQTGPNGPARDNGIEEDLGDGLLMRHVVNNRAPRPRDTVKLRHSKLQLLAGSEDKVIRKNIYRIFKRTALKSQHNKAEYNCAQILKDIAVLVRDEKDKRLLCARLKEQWLEVITDALTNAEKVVKEASKMLKYGVRREDEAIVHQQIISPKKADRDAIEKDFTLYKHLVLDLAERLG